MSIDCFFVGCPQCNEGHQLPQEFKPQRLQFQERSKSSFEGCYSIGSAYWQSTVHIRQDTVHSRLTWAASRFKDCALSKIASSSGVMFHPDKQVCGVNQHLSKNAIKYWQAPGPWMLKVTNSEPGRSLVLLWIRNLVQKSHGRLRTWRTSGAADFDLRRRTDGLALCGFECSNCARRHVFWFGRKVEKRIA